MGKGYYLPKDELSNEKWDSGFLGFIGSEILSSYVGIIENIRLRIYNKLPNHRFPFIVGLVTEGLKTLGGGGWGLTQLHQLRTGIRGNHQASGRGQAVNGPTWGMAKLQGFQKKHVCSENLGCLFFFLGGGGGHLSFQTFGISGYKSE